MNWKFKYLASEFTIVQNYVLLILFGWLEGFFLKLSLSLFCCFLSSTRAREKLPYLFWVAFYCVTIYSIVLLSTYLVSNFHVHYSLSFYSPIILFFSYSFFCPFFFKNIFPACFYNRGHGSLGVTNPIGPFWWLCRSLHWWVLWSC